MSGSMLPIYHSYPPSDGSLQRNAVERLAENRKGKGKERAVEDIESGMDFGIRFTQSEEDLELFVSRESTVRDVKRRIYELRPSLLLDGKPRSLRLIQLGRLLTDGVALVPYTIELVKKREGLVKKNDLLQVLEEVVTESSNGQLPESRQSQERVWLHCSVGEVLEGEEIEKIQQTQITPLRGFDKLIDAGLSASEIQSMREEFRANAAQAIEGDEDEHARALEDQWMEGMTNSAEVSTNEPSQGVYVTLFQGVCVGFFVPYLPFFFFRTQIFSKRMQMAMVLGIVVNLMFGLLRFFS